jgi:hypothetical protein
MLHRACHGDAAAVQPRESEPVAGCGNKAPGVMMLGRRQPQYVGNHKLSIRQRKS